MLYAHLFSFPSIRHPFLSYFFFFNDTATTEIYTLSLHDALPIWPGARADRDYEAVALQRLRREPNHPQVLFELAVRSEEHTSELQSLAYLVCRLLLEKKKKKTLTVVVWNITDSSHEHGRAGYWRL